MDNDQPPQTITCEDRNQKRHSSIITTLRTQETSSRLRDFVFEDLPPELRLQIYRLLLVHFSCVQSFDKLHMSKDSEKINDTGSSDGRDHQAVVGSDDTSSSEEDDDEDIQEKRMAVWLRFPRRSLFLQHLHPPFPLFPGILQSSKLIHKEASAVLYGENAFSWYTNDLISREMWYLLRDAEDFTAFESLPQHYSCLITKMHLFVDLRTGESLTSVTPYDFPIIEDNIKEVSSRLALRNLSFLKVDIRYPRLWLRRTVTGTVLERRKSAVQRCLAPLKKVPTSKVSL